MGDSILKHLTQHFYEYHFINYIYEISLIQPNLTPTVKRYQYYICKQLKLFIVIKIILRST